MARTGTSISVAFRVLIILIALTFAIAPVLHNHPLVQRGHGGTAEASSLCATCAAGAAQEASLAPIVGIPAVVLYRLAVVTIERPSADTSLASPSRAPPAA